MKKIGVPLFALAAVAFGVLFFVHGARDAQAANVSYTCQPNGVFRTLPTATLTADDIQRSTQALDWIRGQERTTTAIEGDGQIITSQQYAKDHTGPVTGTFDLGTAQYAITSDASIEILSPASIPDSFAGVVQGKVLTEPTAWRWIIQVYREEGGTYTQVPLQALADATTGEFTIDLSSVANPPAGRWAFGILDAGASYAPYGGQWPSAEYYDGLEVQQKLVTDGIYDWSTTRALADNTYSFDTSNAGGKLIRLVDTASQDVLAEYAPLTGLIRSYEIDDDDPQYGSAFGQETFVYDQAIGIFAALSANDEAFAERLVDGMLLMQETTGVYTGGFVFAAPQLGPEYRNALIRTGAHAIATDALLAFIEKYPQSSQYDAYKSRAELALTFIEETYSTGGFTQGLYLGGYGDYIGPGGSFAPTTEITWASTEHNIDIWHAFTRAGAVIDAGYTSKANELQQAMTAKLFNATEGRYNQGMTSTGPDTADPLDVNSWGAIQLYATGQMQRAETSLSSLQPFMFTRAGVTGYAPFYDSPGYPGATPNVWYEGSYGVLMAFARTGKSSEYRSLLNSLKNGQEADGAFRYATDIDPIYEISDHKSVASTGWFILSTTGIDAMWNRCTYTAPEETEVEGEVPVTPSSPDTSKGVPSSRQEGSAVVVSEITTDTTEINRPDKENDAPGGDTTGQPSRPQEGESKATIEPWMYWVGGGIAGVVVISGVAFALRRK